MMICYQESPTHQSSHLQHWMTEIELTGEECPSQKGVKTSKVCQRSTIGNYTSTYIQYIFNFMTYDFLNLKLQHYSFRQESGKKNYL